MLLVVNLSFLYEKQLLMKLLFENQQTYANLFLGLITANTSPIRCVNPCRPVFTRVGVWSKRQLDSRLEKKRPLALKNLVMSFFQRTRPECRLENFYTTAKHMKNGYFSVTEFVLIAHCDRSNGLLLSFSFCQEVKPSLTEEDIKRSSRKRELDELRRS